VSLDLTKSEDEVARVTTLWKHSTPAARDGLYVARHCHISNLTRPGGMARARQQERRQGEAMRISRR